MKTYRRQQNREDIATCQINKHSEVDLKQSSTPCRYSTGLFCIGQEKKKKRKTQWKLTKKGSISLFVELHLEK